MSYPYYPLITGNPLQKLWRFCSIIAGVVFLTALPTIGQAQTSTGEPEIIINGLENLPPEMREKAKAQVEEMLKKMDELSKKTDEARDKVLGKMYATRVLITPSLIHVDVDKKIATIEFENKTEDTIEATVRISSQPPINDPYAELFGLKPNTAVDSNPASQALGRWIKKLPSSVKLAPGEKKTVTVTFDVPADVQPGEYSAWIVTTNTLSMKYWMEELNKAAEQVYLESGDVAPDFKLNSTVEMGGQEITDQMVSNEGGAKLVYLVKSTQ